MLSAAACMLARVGNAEPAAGQGPEDLVITTSNAGNFTQDAIILAARVARGPWLSVEAATGFDTDLARIRERHPELQDVHARPDTTMTELMLALDLDAP